MVATGVSRAYRLYRSRRKCLMPPTGLNCRLNCLYAQSSLGEQADIQAGPKTILEVGCGAGNTVFPLLNHNENPDLQLWATDYSAQAVEVVKVRLYPASGRIMSL